MTSPPATRSVATWATWSRPCPRSIRRRSSSSWPTSSASRTTIPELSQKPAFVQVPQLVLTDALSPLTPTLDGDVKVFNLTIDEMEWKIDELMPPVAALGLQRPVAGPDDPRQPGRQGPGDLQEQPARDHRRPLPRRRVRRLLPGRRPVRHPEADHPGRGVRLRLRRAQPRLADVPLAPQRDRPGRARPAGRLHRGSAQAAGRVRPRVHLDLQRHARRVHDQRPRLPGHRPGARRPGREGPRPVHERGQHDAPVAQPRLRDGGRRPRRHPARQRLVQGRHARA